MSSLSSFKAIIFDVYGTLVDWETPIYEGLLPITKKYPASQTWSRKEALKAYCAVETDIEAQHPEWLYARVLEKSHEEFERRLSGQGSGVDQTSIKNSGGSSTSTSASTLDTSDGSDNPHVKFARSIRDWPPFSDTIEALRSLAKRYKLTVLSNVDHESFAYTHAKLSDDIDHPDLYTYSPQSGNTSSATGTIKILDPSLVFHPRKITNSRSPFTLVLTAQDTGAYKPSPNGIGAAIQCILDDPEYDVKDQSEILVVAVSLFHDVYPAHKLGLRSVWIHRRGTCMGLGVEDSDVDTPARGADEVDEDDRARQLGAGKWSWRFETLVEFAVEVERQFDINSN